MVDYQEMYYKMNRAMEKVINILVEAQRECEDDYLKQTDPPSEREEKEDNGYQSRSRLCGTAQHGIINNKTTTESLKRPVPAHRGPGGYHDAERENAGKSAL